MVRYAVWPGRSQEPGVRRETLLQRLKLLAVWDASLHQGSAPAKPECLRYIVKVLLTPGGCRDLEHGTRASVVYRGL